MCSNQLSCTMKKLMYAALLLLCSPEAMAQLSFTELKGKWQEKSRQNNRSQDLEFTDTLRIEFTESGFTQIRYQEGPTYLGEAELNGKRLKLKGLSFELDKNNEQEMVLRMDGQKHIMLRTAQFMAAPIAKVIPAATPGQTEGVIRTDLPALAGKWTCYRKTDPAFSKLTFYIKHLEIFSLQSAELTLHNMDSVYVELDGLKVLERSLELNGPQGVQTLSILKSDGEELILQKGGLVYYFKRFGKK